MLSSILLHQSQLTNIIYLRRNAVSWGCQCSQAPLSILRESDAMPIQLLIRSQADHRIDFRGAACGKIAGQHGDTHEHERCTEEGERVAGGDAE